MHPDGLLSLSIPWLISLHVHVVLIHLSHSMQNLYYMWVIFVEQTINFSISNSQEYKWFSPSSLIKIFTQSQAVELACRIVEMNESGFFLHSAVDLAHHAEN